MHLNSDFLNTGGYLLLKTYPQIWEKAKKFLMKIMSRERKYEKENWR